MKSQLTTSLRRYQDRSQVSLRSLTLDSPVLPEFSNEDGFSFGLVTSPMPSRPGLTSICHFALGALESGLLLAEPLRDSVDGGWASHCSWGDTGLPYSSATCGWGITTFLSFVVWATTARFGFLSGGRRLGLSGEGRRVFNGGIVPGTLG